MGVVGSTEQAIRRCLLVLVRESITAAPGIAPPYFSLGGKASRITMVELPLSPQSTQS